MKTNPTGELAANYAFMQTKSPTAAQLLKNLEPKLAVAQSSRALTLASTRNGMVPLDLALHALGQAVVDKVLLPPILAYEYVAACPAETGLACASMLCALSREKRGGNDRKERGGNPAGPLGGSRIRRAWKRGMSFAKRAAKVDDEDTKYAAATAAWHERVGVDVLDAYTVSAMAPAPLPIPPPLTPLPKDPPAPMGTIYATVKLLAQATPGGIAGRLCIHAARAVQWAVIVVGSSVLMLGALIVSVLTSPPDLVLDDIADQHPVQTGAACVLSLLGLGSSILVAVAAPQAMPYAVGLVSVVVVATLAIFVGRIVKQGSPRFFLRGERARKEVVGEDEQAEAEDLKESLSESAASTAIGTAVLRNWDNLLQLLVVGQVSRKHVSFVACYADANRLLRRSLPSSPCSPSPCRESSSSSRSPTGCPGWPSICRGASASRS